MNANVEKIQELCDELDHYCVRELIPRMSADELLVSDVLSDRQREYIRDFIARWDAIAN